MGNAMRESHVNRLEPYLTKTPVSPPAPEIEPQSWGEMAESWEGRFQDFLGEHPKLTIAAAAAVGMVLGWIVKRK
jgi:hypothetical protein